MKRISKPQEARSPKDRAGTAARRLLNIGLLCAGLAVPASASIVIVAEETEAGVLWSFTGSLVATAGTATVAEGVAGATDGYLLRYTTRGTGAPSSTITVGYGGQVQAPYFKSVQQTAWSFLAFDSLTAGFTGDPGQQTIRPSDNVGAMVFTSSGRSTTDPLTQLFLLGNTQTMVLDRTILAPGLTFADLNMTAEIGTVYPLSGGDTLQFVTSIPEPTTGILAMTGLAGFLAMRRRPGNA